MVEQQAPKKRLSLTSLILLGLALGLMWGLLLGDYGAWIKAIGDVYIGLLQMAVLPYVALSLIANVGRLSRHQGGRLARVAIKVLLTLWAIGFLVLIVMDGSFPPWEAGSFYSVSLVEEPEPLDWLNLFVPSNVFWSLTHNLVPAVVVFSLGLGTALMSVPGRESLLEKLDVAIEALGRLNKMVVRISPVGIFAIVGHAAGTMSGEQFGLLQGYLLVYGAASLLLSLWLLPALIAACTPFTYRDVLSSSRDTLITAFVIGNTFIVMPLIIDAVKRLLDRHRMNNIDASHMPEYLVPLAYPFPDIGRIVGLVFIPFAAWFYGSSIHPHDYPALLGVGFVGAFAKPVVTVPLLLDLAEIPSDIFHLYLSVGVVASRFGDLMKAMHLFAFTALTVSVLAGAFRLELGRLLVPGISTALAFALSILAIRGVLSQAVENAMNRENPVTHRQLLWPEREATILHRAAPNPVPLLEKEDPIDRIRRRGVIRIGFDPTRLPFAYFNGDQQLVGFDIDMAHQLARDLNAKIEFVPASQDVKQSLRRDEFDIAMSAYEGTLKRAVELPHVSSYMDVTVALVVPDFRRNEFSSLDYLRRQPGLRVAVVAESASAELETQELQGLDIVEIASEREFFESRPPVADVLVTSAEVGSAWTLRYPSYGVVKPDGIARRLPLYYLVDKESQFEEFMENWLALKERDGSIQQLYDYWILGREKAGQKKPRWCILRDVLHWVN